MSYTIFQSRKNRFKKIFPYSSMAEHPPVKRRVVGSSPTGGAKNITPLDQNTLDPKGLYFLSNQGLHISKITYIVTSMPQKVAKRR